jgi:hypothetical protein
MKIKAQPTRSNRSRLEFGQALIELAFLVPFLLLLCLGVIEFGRYAYIGILVGNAARSGVAYGSQSLPLSSDGAGIRHAAQYDFAGTTSGGAARSNGQSVDILQIDDPVTSCSCDNAGTVTSRSCDPLVDPNAGSCTAGHWVVTLSVRAHGTFNSLFRYPGFPASIIIDRTASMRVAQI